jgi:hypothetical protein
MDRRNYQFEENDRSTQKKMWRPVENFQDRFLDLFLPFFRRLAVPPKPVSLQKESPGKPDRVAAIFIY